MTETNFIQAVMELSLSMHLNVFVITDNEMGVINTDNPMTTKMLNVYVKEKK